MPLTQLIKPFYDLLPEGTFRREPALGQIGRVVVPIPEPVPRIFEVKRHDPRNHDVVDAELRNVKAEDFRKDNHLPIYRLRLRAHEELLVQRSKRRLAIVVSLFGSTFD